MKKIKNYVYNKIQRVRQINMQTHIRELIEDEDFKKIENLKPVSKNKIAILVWGMLPYSGGHTSILRLGTQLVHHGYEVSYVSINNQNIYEMEKNAEINLPDYKGKIYTKDYLNGLCADIVIATLWESVYYAKKLPGYKMYFLQDYEPYFYEYNEYFFLAKKTYELGLHMVSLGGWNKWKIEKECNVKGIDVIDFPYENKEYRYKERDFFKYSNNDEEIIIAVYIKRDGKRMPNLIQLMLKKMVELFEMDGKKIRIKFFGLDKKDKVLVGENLGKLTQEELQKLYHDASFGMVASMSNISLVPYEMMATGLPIIEFQEGTFSYFFSDEAAILTDFSYVTLYEKLSYLLKHPKELQRMQQQALEELKSLSWEKSGEQFVKIIEQI